MEWWKNLEIGYSPRSGVLAVSCRFIGTILLARYSRCSQYASSASWPTQCPMSARTPTLHGLIPRCEGTRRRRIYST
jgi:hypothetical protein